MTVYIAFLRKLLPFIVIFFSFAVHAEIGHLSIRGHKQGELVYENGNRKYYLTTTKDGYYYFVAIHNVGADEKMVERIFQTPNNPSGQQEFVYSDKELEIFRHFLLPQLKKKSKRINVVIHHYNANVLLENNRSTFGEREDPILTTYYRVSNPKRVLEKKEIEAQWYLYYGGDHLNPIKFTQIYRPDYHFVSVDEANPYRKIKTKDIPNAFQKYKQELNQTISTEKKTIAAEVARKKAERQVGIVYKSKHYWQSFINFNEMQDTFNGDFDGLERKKLFKVYYHSFVNQYENNCKAYFSGPTVGRRFVMERVTTQDGNELYRETTTDVTTQMEQRFADKYDAYKDVVYRYYKIKGFGLAFQKSLDIGDMPDFQIDKFFDQVSCDSATMFQMKENLWRVSHGKLSLQAEGIKIKNAEKDSVPVEETINEKTLYEACIEGGDGEFDYRHERYCRCFDSKARIVMTKEELTHYSKNFPKYYAEVTGQIKGINKGDEHWDTLWRLYQPHSRGLKCRDNR